MAQNQKNQQQQQLTQEQLKQQQQQQQEEYFRQEFAYKQRLYKAAKSTFEDLSKRLNEVGGSIFNFMFNTLTSSKGNWPNLEEVLEYAALCKQTGLNPLLKSEVAPLVKGGRVSLIVMRDGWRKLARAQPSYNGMEFKLSDEYVDYNGKSVPAWIEVTIFERGVDYPFTWRTVFNESVVKNSPVWTNEPTNMLQIRAMNRAIRNCFGLAAYDPEEANNFYEVEDVKVQPKQQAAQTALPKKATTKSKVQQALAQKTQALPLKEPEIFEQVLQPEQVPVEEPAQQEAFAVPTEVVEDLPFDVEQAPSGDAVGYGAMNGKTLNNE